MQATLDGESKNKLEALRTKKELEQRVSDLELAIDRMNKSRGDTDKIHKKYQQQLVDLQVRNCFHYFVLNWELLLRELISYLIKASNTEMSWTKCEWILQALFEDEEQMRKKAEEELQNHMQKSDSLKDEVDVLRLQVDSLDRNRRMMESELKDATAKINELNANCSNLSTIKKKLENNFQQTRVDKVTHLSVTLLS